MESDGAGLTDGGAAWAIMLEEHLRKTPLAPSVLEALVPMTKLTFELSQPHGTTVLDLDFVRQLVERKREEIAAFLRAEGCADYPVDFGVAICLYTLEEPPIYQMLNQPLRSPTRAQGPGGMSMALRGTLPMTKYLDTALEEAPAKFQFTGRCHRGVKYVYPSPDDHDPERHFPIGKELTWHQFNSASQDFKTMYMHNFCGDRGPRTIFNVDGVRGVSIAGFSEFANENEILFRPGTRLKVARAQNKLLAHHLDKTCTEGFPDEIDLVPIAEITEGVPPELMMMDMASVGVDFAAPPIGTGGFADVYAGTYRFSAGPAQAVAYKVFRDSKTLQKQAHEQILREAKLGLRLNHKHLIELYGVLIIPDRGVALVLEFADGGSLHSLLNDRQKYPELPWALRVQWLCGIANGMSFLHSLKPKPVIHRDLKAANVLMITQGLAAPIPKIADFGVATIKQHTTASTHAGVGAGAGTTAWKAPETFRGRYNQATDMFSMAVTIYEVITRHQPYESMSFPELLRVANAMFEYDPDMEEEFSLDEQQQKKRWLKKNPLESRRPDLKLVEDGCPPCLVQLVPLCWADDAQARPTFADLEHMLDFDGLVVAASMEPEPEPDFEPEPEPEFEPEPEPEFELEQFAGGVTHTPTLQQFSDGQVSMYEQHGPDIGGIDLLAPSPQTPLSATEREIMDELMRVGFTRPETAEAASRQCHGDFATAVHALMEFQPPNIPIQWVDGRGCDPQELADQHNRIVIHDPEFQKIFQKTVPNGNTSGKCIVQEFHKGGIFGHDEHTVMFVQTDLVSSDEDASVLVEQGQKVVFAKVQLAIGKRANSGLSFMIPVVDENLLKPKAVVSIMCSLVSGAQTQNMRASHANLSPRLRLATMLQDTLTVQVSDDVTVDDRTAGPDPKSNLRFWLIDHEWMSNPENMVSLQAHVLDATDDVTNVLVVFGMVHDDLDLPASTVQFPGDSRKVLLACMKKVAESGVHLLEIFQDSETSAEAFCNIVCMRLQQRYRTLEQKASKWLEDWQEKWKETFGETERVPFEDFRAWVERSRLVPDTGLDTHVWSSLQNQLSSYSYPGTVSILQICRFAETAGGDLSQAFSAFINNRAKGSRIDHPRESADFKAISRLVENSQSSLHPFTLKVTKVEEVKHIDLEATFAAAERRIDGEKRTLLHGTTPRGLESIVSEGFKLPESSFWSSFWEAVGLSTSRMFGAGIYFTPISTKAALYSNLSQSTDTEIKLIAADVLMGNQHYLREADTKMTKEKLDRLGKHCVFAIGSEYNGEGKLQHDEMIVYDPVQTLPRYIVTCRLKAKESAEVKKLEQQFFLLGILKPKQNLSMESEMGVMQRRARDVTGSDSACLVM